MVEDTICTGCLGWFQSDHTVLSRNFLLDECVVVPIKILHLFLILLLLRIVDRQKLHEVVGWVGELGNGSLDVLEILDGLLGVTLVDDVTVSHENEAIEEEEGLGGGRVDRAHNCFTLLTGEFL